MPFLSSLIILSFFLCSNLYAQKKTLDEVLRDGIPGEVYELSEYPDAVYHWLTKQSADKLAHQFESHKNVFPLKDGSLNHSMLGGAFQDLAPRPGLFVWSNPVSGIGFGTIGFEGKVGNDFIYGDQVIKLWLNKKKELKAVAAVSLSGTILGKKQSFEGVDLVFHIQKSKMDDGSYISGLQEWVILNPKAVERYTGNPKDLHQELHHWLEKILDPSFSFSEKELHSPAFLFDVPIQRKKFIAPIVEKITKGHSQLPDVFLNPLSLNSGDNCYSEGIIGNAAKSLKTLEQK